MRTVIPGPLVVGPSGPSFYGAASGPTFAWPLPPLTMIRGSLRSRYLSSQFGPRRNPVTGAAQNHGGLDMPTDVGTPVTALAAGKVGTVVRDHPVAGHYVEVDHGNGYWSRYLHLSRIDVTPGTVLPVGGKVGLSGGGIGIPGAGRTTGPHLHLELWQGKPYAGGKPIDPEPLLTVELSDLLKAAAGEAVEVGERAVAKGKRAARAGAATLRRNWWIVGIGVLGVGAALWLALSGPKTLTTVTPKANPRRRRQRRRQ